MPRAWTTAEINAWPPVVAELMLNRVARGSPDGDPIWIPSIGPLKHLWEHIRDLVPLPPWYSTYCGYLDDMDELDAVYASAGRTRDPSHSPAQAVKWFLDWAAENNWTGSQS